MRGRTLTLVALASISLGACAEAGKKGIKPQTDASSGGGDDDSGGGNDEDAFVPPVDAGPTPVTLTQTASSTPVSGGTKACGTADYTAENSWFRVFSPAASGVTGTLHIEKVIVGIEDATAGQSIQVKIGTYAGAPGASTVSRASITPVTSQTVAISAAVSLGTMEAPITADIPSGTNFIVEVFSPDHTGTTTVFYMGSTAAAETAPGYISTPDCGGIDPPSNVKAAPVSQTGSIVIDVVGSY